MTIISRKLIEIDLTVLVNANGMGEAISIIRKELLNAREKRIVMFKFKEVLSHD